MPKKTVNTDGPDNDSLDDGSDAVDESNNDHNTFPQLFQESGVRRLTRRIVVVTICQRSRAVRKK